MAFNINLGKLFMTLGLDADSLKEEMKDVKKQIKTQAKELRSSANQWGKWGLAVTAAGTVALAAFTKSNLSAIRELKILASTANTQVKEFQRGAFAAKQFGIETEKYGDILKDVNDRVGDFITTGAGPMIDFFEQIGPKIGVTVEDFKGLSGQDALGLYVKSLEKANLSQEEMTFFMEAMASDSTRLIPLFRDNAKVFNALTKEAEALGVGLSDLDVATVELANRELSKTGAFLESIGQEMTVKLAPVITGFSMALNDAAKDAGGFGHAMDNAINFAIDIIGMFADGLRGIEIIFKGLEVAALGFTSIATAAFAELTSLTESIGDQFTEIGKTQGAIGGNFRALGFIFGRTKDEIDGVTKSTSELAEELAKSQLDALEDRIEALKNLALEPLPSDKIRAFVADAQKKFRDELSKGDIIDLTGGIVLGSGTTTGTDQGEKSEADRLREENLAILEALIEGANMREETLIGRLDRERTILEEGLTNKLISQEEFNRASEDLERKSSATKNSIIVSGLSAAAEAIGFFGKKGQKIAQKIAIVSAVISGKEAAVHAWNSGMQTGGPWAPAVAAAYTAASIARTASMIGSIKSAGSSMSGSGGGIPSVTGGGAGTGAGGIGQGQTQAPQETRDITIQLIGQGAQLFTFDQIRQLMDQISEQVGDGFNFATTGG